MRRAPEHEVLRTSAVSSPRVSRSCSRPPCGGGVRVGVTRNSPSGNGARIGSPASTLRTVGQNCRAWHPPVQDWMRLTTSSTACCGVCPEGPPGQPQHREWSSTACGGLYSAGFRPSPTSRRLATAHVKKHPASDSAVRIRVVGPAHQAHSSSFAELVRRMARFTAFGVATGRATSRRPGKPSTPTPRRTTLSARCSSPALPSVRRSASLLPPPARIGDPWASAR